MRHYFQRTRGATAGGLLAWIATGAAAVEVSWTPERPLRQDAIAVVVRGCTQGGTIHWGVNAKAGEWQPASPVYHPTGSYVVGIATRTPLEGPDEEGVCRAAFGPFHHADQRVQSIDFAIHWADGSWDSHHGQDYHIRISSARLRVEPAAPTLNDRLTVTVEQSAQSGFLHWGVNAEGGAWQAPHPAYWPPNSVLYSDLNSVDTALPDPDAAGNSVVSLGPFNRGEQMVTSLHFAARWGEEWETDSGQNYNFSLQQGLVAGAPRVAFLDPTNGATLRSGIVTPRLEVEGAAQVTLWLDGVEVARLSEPPYETTLTLSNLDHRAYTLLARAEKGGQAGMDKVVLWHTPDVGQRPLTGDIAPGATLHDDGTATFALFAPGKQFVSLVGDFNQWDSSKDILNVTTDGTWWIRRLLPPGLHTYQYSVEGNLLIADPYSRDVDWRDEERRETYHAHLAKSVIEAGKPPYAWNDRGFQRPPLENLLIYEFYIDDLCPGKGFLGVIEKLDYIRGLGANAIEPLPVTEFTGASSWGYNPAFHFAPESAYGTPDDLKRLVDEAHRRGLAVIFDVVLNHMDKFSPLFQLYGEDYEASPYFHRFEGENWGFPDLDQESDAFKRYARDLVEFWLKEYHMDGFRYDATRWVGWHGHHDWGGGWFAYAGKQADPRSYQIAEHIGPEPEFIRGTDMDSGWDSDFRWRLRDMLRHAQLDAPVLAGILDARASGYDHPVERMVYVESHDEERLLRELLLDGYTFDQALQRCLTAAAIMLTTPGVAMLYSGQETGEFKARRVGPNPTDWSHLDMPVFDELHAGITRLGRLRTGHPALQTDHIEVLRNDADADILVVQRAVPKGTVWLAANFGRAEQSVTADLDAARTWTDVLRESRVEIVPGTPVDVTLPPGGVKIFQSGSS